MPTYSDMSYLQQFLLTYRTFATPEELLSLLVDRADMPDPVHASDRQLSEYQVRARIGPAAGKGCRGLARAAQGWLARNARSPDPLPLTVVLAAPAHRRPRRSRSPSSSLLPLISSSSPLPLTVVLAAPAHRRRRCTRIPLSSPVEHAQDHSVARFQHPQKVDGMALRQRLWRQRRHAPRDAGRRRTVHQLWLGSIRQVAHGHPEALPVRPQPSGRCLRTARL